MSIGEKKISQVKHQLGFTLLEMLVAISVFVIITTIALGIYASIMRANKKSILLTRLQRDAQVIMVAISKKIRQSQVNYTYYTLPIADSVEQLAIIDADGVKYVYQLNQDEDTIQIKTGEEGEFEDIPAGDVAITDLDFYISPNDVDPFEGTPDAPPSEFPKVTMVLRLEPRNAPAGFEDHLIVQHTVPQRGGGY